MKRSNDDSFSVAEKKIKFIHEGSYGLPAQGKFIADQPLFCQICGTINNESNLCKLVDKSGLPTEAGAMLATVLTPMQEEADFESNTQNVCKFCLAKVRDCFTLMVELKTGEHVVRKIETDMGVAGFRRSKNKFLHVCNVCGQEAVGKDMLQKHYQMHVRKNGLELGGFMAQFMDEETKDAEEADKFELKSKPDLSTTVLQQARKLLFDDVHEQQLFSCEQCGKDFKYNFLLTLHQAEAAKAAQDSESVVPCDKCSMDVKLSDIVKHTSLCKGRPNTIVITSGSTNKPPQGPDARCFVCNEINFGKNAARGEPCTNCVKKFKLPSNDRSQILTNSTSSAGAKKNKSHICDICGRGFAYNYSLRIHMKSHDGQLKNVLILDTSCHLCNILCSSANELKVHLKNEHNIQHYENRVICVFCKKKFVDSYSFKLHLKIFHNQNKNIRIKGYREFHCTECNLVLTSEHATKLHMNREHGLTRGKVDSLRKVCEICNKSFAGTTGLAIHMNSTHLNKRPMECDECGLKFAKHSSLICHKLRHTGSKYYQCEVCSKSFRQRNDVIRHLARHVRDQEVDFLTASAINTSDSPHITKRQIFLRDSTMKGVLDVTLSPRRLPSNKTIKLNLQDGVAIARKGEQIITSKDDDQILFYSHEAVTDGDSADEYEEVILDENDTVLMNENGDIVEGELITENGVQYIQMGNERIELSDVSVAKLNEDDMIESGDDVSGFINGAEIDADYANIVGSEVAPPLVYHVLPDGSFVQQ